LAESIADFAMVARGTSITVPTSAETLSHARHQLPDGVVELSRHGQYLLLHPRLPKFALLNETARFIASLCDGTRTSLDIAGVVASHYGIGIERGSSDVELSLKQLEASGMFSDAPFPGGACPALCFARQNKRVHLTITGRCNLRCAHCGTVGSLHKNDALAASDVRSIVDQLAEVRQSSIAITGGEPLLRKDIVEIVQYSAERTKTILSTNGTLITQDIARRLGPLPITFQVSLDGATAEVHDAIRGVGEFSRALNGIKLLQENGAGANVEICRTIMGQPEDDFEALLELGECLGVGGIRFLCLARLGRADDSYDTLSPTAKSYRKFYEAYFKAIVDPNSRVAVGGGIPGLYIDVPDSTMWCHVGEMLEVSPEGKIYPCSMLNRDEYELGNIWEMTLQQAAECDKFVDLHKLLAGRVERIEVCRKCAFKNYCQAGCPGMALADNGTLMAQDSICELRKELFEDLFFEVFPKLGSKKGLRSSEEIQV